MASKKNLSAQRSNYSTRSTVDFVIPARHYHAYLLRIWREDENTPWRIQLETPHTSETLGFASLENLYAFLKGQTAQELRDENT